MQTFVTREEINTWRVKQQVNNSKVGFVPTMGALHQGHLSLVKQAIEENDLVVVSIFVNPKQFNQHADLEAYPRMLAADIQYLEDLGSIVVFAPNEQEMYPANVTYSPMPLGKIGTLLEGKQRPGHFEGVVHVVHHLFELIKPHKAYFGQKDFQQLAIIRQLNAYYGFGIEIIGCQTIREPDGLAMSSRNLRLNAEERQQALAISKALFYVQQKVGKVSIEELIYEASAMIINAGLILEYLAIVDPLTLENCQAWQEKQVCCVAAFCGEVRLIDNVLCESVL